MNLKIEKTTIGGVEYSTQQLPAMRSFKLFARLAKTLGPMLGALGGIKSMADLKALVEADDLGAIAGQLGEALAKLDVDEAQGLIVEILAGTVALVPGPQKTVQVPLGSSTAIDAHFSGRMGDMMRVVAHAARVNFADFFSESAPAAVATLTPAAARGAGG